MALPEAETMDFLCDWCGENVEEEGSYSELCCRRGTCGRHVYHQNCIEEHLRKCKLTPDRLSGFPCPRGHGRQRRGEGLQAAICDPCNGKIDSTHKKITKAKNKQKNAATAQVYVPPPKPAPGPKKKVPQPPQPQLQLPPAKLAKPTPVRGGGLGPSHTQAEAPGKTRAQMLAVVASLRQEISGAVPSKEQSAAQLRTAAAATAAAARVRPGAGAAARLGKQEQSVYIPGMEPADPVPRPAPAAPNHAAAPVKPFNLHEEKSSFPTLGQAVANNNVTSGAHLHKHMADPGSSGAINALNPDHAKGFVTDLARYNALLGANAYDDGRDGESSASELPELAPDDSYSADYEQSSSGQEGAPSEASWDPNLLTDRAVVQAYLYGMDAVGLPAEYAPLVQQLYAEFGDPSNEWEGLHDAAAQPVETRHAEYLEPERGVQNLADSMEAIEEAQIQYAQQQSLMGIWAVPTPVVTKAQPRPQAASLVPHIPEASKVAQLHVHPAAQVDEDVDEELYEDLLALCL